MSIQLANQVKHLVQSVQYLTEELESLQERVLALEAMREKKVAALELEVPSVREIPDPGKQKGLK